MSVCGSFEPGLGVYGTMTTGTTHLRIFIITVTSDRCWSCIYARSHGVQVRLFDSTHPRRMMVTILVRPLYLYRACERASKEALLPYQSFRSLHDSTMNIVLVFALVVPTVATSIGTSAVTIGDCGKSRCPVDAVPRGRTLERNLQGVVALSGLDLIDSVTEKRIMTLTNNQVIVVDQIPGMTTPSFNINATFVGTAVKSVVFGYGATTFRTDNFAPFSFCGNTGPLYNTCSLLGLGTHVVTATPYSFQGGAGIVGSPATVTFTVVATAPIPAPKPPTLAPIAPTPVAAPATAVVSNYNIQLDLSKITATADQNIFASAAAKWQSVITGDLTSFDPRSLPPRDDGCQWPSSIDDLFVCAKYQAIDGPSNVLGFAGPEYIRNANGLPFSGVMTFDIDDLTRLRGNGGGKFLNTILHEMGHILGT
jgi:hypothetical protein